MVLIALGIAVLDGLITFLNIKEREQWIMGSISRAVVLDGLTSLAIGVSICVFVEFTWIMLVPSVIGSMVGRYLAWKL
jgi:uncharacterized membrane protein YqgA involved in biofilm formation